MAFSKRSARKVGSTTEKNGLFCEHSLLVDENGLTETTHVNRNFVSWEAVEKVSETANYVTIHIRLGSGYFIPKRAFSSPDDIQDLRRRRSNSHSYNQHSAATRIPLNSSWKNIRHR